MLDAVENPWLGFTLLTIATALSIFALQWMGIRVRPIREKLGQRFIHGVPWGTLMIALLLLVVYAFVQRGFWHWDRPVITAFTAVSMFDPVGLIFSGFSHTSSGHLRGNITSLFIFGAIVEYAWGHYPQTQRREWEPEWTHNPRVRAFVLFPAAIVIVGILTAMFSWGPVIGFSVAVYALIGAALVQYPILTLVGLVAREFVRLLWRTVTDPVVVTSTSVRVVRPSWYGSAVQGHLIGLLIGVMLGIALLRYHQRRPDAGKLWLSTVFLGSFLSLWAIWWVLGPERFVLFRAAGVAIVLLVATVITLAVIRPVGIEFDPGKVAVGVLIVAIVGMGVIGVAINLATAEPPDRPVAAEVEDYEIYYGENVPDGMINIVEVEFLGITSDVTTSGVIVYSEQRNVWRQPVSATELQTRGSARFTVGGIGWSEDVVAIRDGWQVAGSPPVYQIWIGVDGEANQAYQSQARMASPTIDSHNFTLEPHEDDFRLNVTVDNQTEYVDIPEDEESVAVHDVTIVRDNRQLLVTQNGTEVVIAQEEFYR